MNAKKINFEKLAEVFKALGHPQRLQIVAFLLDASGANVNTLVEKLSIPQSSVSQQLNILKKNGIIGSRKNGVKTCCSISDAKIGKIFKIMTN